MLLPNLFVQWLKILKWQIGSLCPENLLLKTGQSLRQQKALNYLVGLKPERHKSGISDTFQGQHDKFRQLNEKSKARFSKTLSNHLDVVFLTLSKTKR